jgi:TonB family protein
MLRILATLLLIAASASAQTGAQTPAPTDTWLEVRTPSFLVVTNSTEKDGRRVARQFEQMRLIFRRIFPDSDLETPSPIVVIAVVDKQNLQALEPEVYLAKGQVSLVGLFLSSPEKNFVLLWLAGRARHPYAPIYHEYAHFVTSRTGEWTPLWLNEGLAQFYENTEILDDEVRLGEGSVGTLEFLQRNALLPIPVLVAVDPQSPYYHEEDKASMFYAESWALTHYLKSKDARDNSHLIDDYLALVRRNVDTVSAATQAFGDLEQLQADLRKYIVSQEYSYTSMPGSTDVDDSSFPVRALTKAEADTVRAEFLATDHRETDARKLLDSVLREDPTNVSALATMGYAAYQQGDYDEGRKWCGQSIKLDPQSFFAQFCFAASILRKGSTDAASLASMESSLRAAIKINPSFALAYDALGMSFALHGRNLDEAYSLLQRAVELDRGTLELRVDEAQVLMRLGRYKEAADVLDLALKMSHTPEQSAAVETVQQTLKKFTAARAKTPGVTDLKIGPASGTNQASSAGVTEARAIFSPEPEYTEQAREAGRQGTCIVSLIVGLDGKPSNIVVTKKLGLGLDEKAVEAVSKWKFEPARRFGRPVLTRLTLSLQFKLFGGGTEKFFDLSEKAKAGDAAAEFELAKVYFEGHDIPKDDAQGLRLLERAARHGLAPAQFQMGERIYGDGNSSDKYVEAYVWYALAQQGGFDQSDAKVTELESRMTEDQLSEARKRLQNSGISPAK